MPRSAEARKTAADVEAVLHRLVRLDREKGGRHPVDVGLELVPVPRDVAFGQEDEVDPVVRISRDESFVDPVRRRGLLADDVIIGRVDDPVEDGLEQVALIALLDHEEDRAFRQGEPDGALEDPDRSRQRRRGRLVLREHRIEAPRKDETVGGGIVDPADVAAVIEGRNEAGLRFGPERLLDDLVDGDRLGLGVAGLVEVDPQGLVDEEFVEGRLGWGAAPRGQRTEKRGSGRPGPGSIFSWELLRSSGGL